MKKELEKLLIINKQRYEYFFSNYELENKVLCNVTAKTFLESTHNYKCRFCGKEKPDVKFKKDAHVIPQLLGNRFVLSKYECDACNRHFSLYEDSLASYLGLFRTMARLSGQKGKGVPKYKNPTLKFEAFYDGTKVQMKSSSENKVTIVNEEEKTLSITATKPVYVPLFVYKALLKIGICLLPENEIEYHRITIDFLRNDSLDDQVRDLPFLRLFSYFIPGPSFAIPSTFLFKKKAVIDIKEIPEHTFLIFFQNHMYQIFFPYCDNDKHLYKVNENNNVSFPIAPLIFYSKLLPENTLYTWDNVDLSSNVKIENEPYVLNLKFDNLKKNE